VALARGSLLALALAACAWFALGIEQARDTDQATAILSSPSPLSPATASHVRSLLATAGTLDPDLTIDLLRGRLALLQHDSSGAVAIFERATRREPQNLDAWVALAQATLHGTNAAVIERAAAAIARLDPRIN
jgi:cytochrome c-type biogenesis protein CcmH/NrfG